MHYLWLELLCRAFAFMVAMKSIAELELITLREIMLYLDPEFPRNDCQIAVTCRRFNIVWRRFLRYYLFPVLSQMYIDLAQSYIDATICPHCDYDGIEAENRGMAACRNCNSAIVHPELYSRFHRLLRLLHRRWQSSRLITCMLTMSPWLFWWEGISAAG